MYRLFIHARPLFIITGINTTGIMTNGTPAKVNKTTQKIGT